MKKTLRKMVIIVCAMAFAFFSTLAYPAQKADAFVWGAAIPGGITIGAGAYTIGALGLAGMVGLIGYDEHGEAIKAHGQQVWQDGTQAAKDSLNVSIDMAKGAGTGLVNLQGDFITFIDGKLDDISSGAYQSTVGGIPDVAGAVGVTYTSVVPREYTISINTADTVNKSAGTHMFYNGKTISSASLKITQYALSWTYYVVEDGRSISGTKAINRAYYDANYATIANSNTTASFISALAKYSDMAYVIGTTAQPLDLPTYQTGVTKTREAWESMKDAGLVLPVDSAVPLNAETGEPLTYNPDADNYTGIDGGVYTGTPAWAFPQPKIREGQTDIPDGVYVDTPTLTGNPAYDDPILGNPAIPKTTTNIYTGTTVANPDTPITAEPVVPGTPDFAEPGSKSIDWKPFLRSGNLMKEKFPFSIPFDFITQLQVLNVEPVAPEFNINVQDYLKIGGYTIPFKMDLSFEMFDPIANIIRWGLIIVFDISLIFAIRKLLPE